MLRKLAGKVSRNSEDCRKILKVNFRRKVRSPWESQMRRKVPVRNFQKFRYSSFLEIPVNASVFVTEDFRQYFGTFHRMESARY